MGCPFGGHLLQEDSKKQNENFKIKMDQNVPPDYNLGAKFSKEMSSTGFNKTGTENAWLLGDGNECICTYEPLNKPLKKIQKIIYDNFF